MKMLVDRIREASSRMRLKGYQPVAVELTRQDEEQLEQEIGAFHHRPAKGMKTETTRVAGLLLLRTARRSVVTGHVADRDPLFTRQREPI